MKESFVDENNLIIPENRCIYCNGIEVIDLLTSESNMKNNKVEEDRYFCCKNQEECEDNLKNTFNSSINLSISESFITFTDQDDNVTKIPIDFWERNINGL